MRIMVIEDDFAVRETLGLVLEACSHTAELVEDGAGAMARLKDSWPDVLILDLTLEDMTGEEVFSQIMKEFGRVPPTLVLSADPLAADRVRRMLGARLLAKPYTIEELDAALKRIAEESGEKAA